MASCERSNPHCKILPADLPQTQDLHHAAVSRTAVGRPSRELGECLLGIALHRCKPHNGAVVRRVCRPIAHRRGCHILHEGAGRVCLKIASCGWTTAMQRWTHFIHLIRRLTTRSWKRWTGSGARTGKAVSTPALNMRKTPGRDAFPKCSAGRCDRATSERSILRNKAHRDPA